MEKSMGHDLATKRNRLAARLLDGERRIQQAEAQRQDVTAWETFWLGLLREYEAVCDELRTVAEVRV